MARAKLLRLSREKTMPRGAMCSVCATALRVSPIVAEAAYGCAHCANIVCPRCRDDAKGHGACIERRRALSRERLQRRLEAEAENATSGVPRAGLLKL
jgi:hypothetical protein